MIFVCKKFDDLRKCRQEKLKSRLELLMAQTLKNSLSRKIDTKKISAIILSFLSVDMHMHSYKCYRNQLVI